MDLSIWLLFVTTVFFLSAAPGPNMLLTMTHGIYYGIRPTFITCCGLMAALALIMSVSAAGLGALLETSVILFTVVKYMGAIYLIYLGIRTWRAKARPIANACASSSAPPLRGWDLFSTGFLVAISNPKAFIFFTALFPQFMDAHQPEGLQLAILAATFFIVEAAWQFVYASSGARLARWLTTDHRLTLVNRISGGMFIGAGVLLASVSARS